LCDASALIDVVEAFLYRIRSALESSAPVKALEHTDDDPLAWAYSIEEYGPHVSLEKPEASPRVTDLVPLYPRQEPNGVSPRWRVFEDITHGWWGIEIDGDNDGDPIMYPQKMSRKYLDGIVNAHNASVSSAPVKGEDRA
jgi:hypothetical protein